MAGVAVCGAGDMEAGAGGLSGRDWAASAVEERPRANEQKKAIVQIDLNIRKPPPRLRLPGNRSPGLYSSLALQYFLLDV